MHSNMPIPSFFNFVYYRARGHSRKAMEAKLKKDTEKQPRNESNDIASPANSEIFR